MGKNRLEAFSDGVIASLLFGIATVRYGSKTVGRQNKQDDRNRAIAEVAVLVLNDSSAVIAGGELCASGLSRSQFAVIEQCATS